MDPESLLRVRRMRESLRKAMKAVLNEREQKAVGGVYVLGWNRKEAAEHLGTTENNVDQILFRARRKLADALGPDGRLLLQ
jgi:RNA polymerase sigma factor (sigma-70 family)